METDNDVGEEILIGSGNVSNSVPAKSFNCSICSRTFTMRRLYERHLQMHANGLSNSNSGDFYAWGETNLIGIPTANTVDNAPVFPEPEEADLTDYPCNMCDRVFSSLKGLKSHVTRVHEEGGEEGDIPLNGAAGSGSPMIVCDLCGCYFGNRDDLITHLVEIHGTTIVKPEPVGVSQPTQKSSEQQNRRNDVLNQNKFPTTTPAIVNSNGFENNYRPNQVSRIDLDEAVPFCEHQCYVCQREFVSARALNSHMREIHGIENNQEKDGEGDDNKIMIPLPNVHADYDVECEEDITEDGKQKRTDDHSIKQELVQRVKTESFDPQPTLPILRPGDRAGIVISNVFSLNEVSETLTNPHPTMQLTVAGTGMLQRRRSRTSDAADYVHMCRFCGKAYAHPSNKFRHQRVCSLRHSSSQDSTDETDPSDSSITISVNASSTGHDCHVCGSRFTNAVGLGVHLRKMHGGELEEEEDETKPSPFFCCDCGVKFSTLSNLGSHRKKNCPYRDEPAETAGVWRCYTCGSPFPSVIAYLQHGMDNPTHCRIHHQQQKEQQQFQETSDKPWPCTLCRKFFATKPELNEHRQVTHGLGSYVLNAPGNWHCPVCQRQFRYKHHMIRHQRSAHDQAVEDDLGSADLAPPEIEILPSSEVPTFTSPTNIKGLSCEDCGIAFSTRRLLIRHMERVHRVVDNQVTRIDVQVPPEINSDLEITPVWIGGKEAFLCNRPGCSRVFSSKNGLSVHLYRAHVRPTLELPQQSAEEAVEASAPPPPAAAAATTPSGLPQVKILPRPANLTKAQVHSSWESCAVFPGPQPIPLREDQEKETAELEEDEVEGMDELEEDEVEDWEDDGGLPTMAGMIYSNAGRKRMRNLPRCHLCGKKFRSQMGLKVHHSIMHNRASKRFGDMGHAIDPETQDGDLVSFACPLCGREFTTAPGLKRHNTRSHGGTPGPRRGARKKMRQSVPMPPTEGKEEEDREDAKEHDTSAPAVLLSEPTNQTTNKEVAPPEPEPVPDDSVSPYSRRIRTPTVERYRCTVCRRNFTSAMGLRVHSSRMHGIPQVLEDEEEMDDVDGVEEATDGEEDDENANTFCDHCNKEFPTVFGLKVHLGRIHSVPGTVASRSARYSAPTMVSMASTRPLSLTETSDAPGEDDWTCTICNRSFRNRMGLSTHQRTHGSKAPARVFGCERCLQRFTKWCNMVTHQKTCCPVKLGLFCPYCDERFDQGLEMYSHIAGLHAESENDVPCPKCPERFSSPTKLREHLSMTHVPCEDDEDEEQVEKKTEKEVEMEAVKEAEPRKDVEPPPKPQRIGKVTFSTPPRRSSLPVAVVPPTVASTTIEVASAGPHARKPPCFDIVQTADVINFACKHCDRIYPSQKAVEGHQSAHKSKRRQSSPDYLPLPPKRPRVYKPPRQRFNEDIMIPGPDSGGPFPCQHCDKVFKSIQAVYAHQRAHSPSRRHLCTDCGRGFVSRTSLAYHRSWYCTGSRTRRRRNRKRLKKKKKKMILEEEVDEEKMIVDEMEPEPGEEEEEEDEEEGNSIEEQDEEMEDEEMVATDGEKDDDGSSTDFLFGCSICGKMFRFENRMLDHKRTAHPNFVKPQKKTGNVVIPITEILNESARDQDQEEKMEEALDTADNEDQMEIAPSPVDDETEVDEKYKSEDDSEEVTEGKDNSKLTDSKGKVEVTDSKDKVEVTDAKVTDSKDKVEVTDAKVTDSKDKVGVTDAKVTDSKDKVEVTDAKVTDSKDKVEVTDAKVTDSKDKVGVTDSKDKVGVTDSNDKVSEMEVSEGETFDLKQSDGGAGEIELPKSNNNSLLEEKCAQRKSEEDTSETAETPSEMQKEMTVGE